MYLWIPAAKVSWQKIWVRSFPEFLMKTLHSKRQNPPGQSQKSNLPSATSTGEARKQRQLGALWLKAGTNDLHVNKLRAPAGSRKQSGASADLCQERQWAAGCPPGCFSHLGWGFQWCASEEWCFQKYLSTLDYRFNSWKEHTGMCLHPPQRSTKVFPSPTLVPPSTSLLC